MSGQHHKAMRQGAHCSLINCPAETMPGYNHSAVQTLLNSWAPGQGGIIKNHLELSHGVTVEIPVAIRFTLFLLAVLGLHCYSRAVSSCPEQGSLLLVALGLLVALATLVEHRL